MNRGSRRLQLDENAPPRDPPAPPPKPSCLDCHWFAPRTEEQAARFVPGLGFCHVRLPPVLAALTWGSRNEPIKDPEHYCAYHPRLIAKTGGVL